MGDQSVNIATDHKAFADFNRYLLNDIAALELLLSNNLIETGITRIGAEQELCLTDRQWMPSQKAHPILESINDPHFTHELAKYNLEINLDPLELKTYCFSDLENHLKGFLKHAAKHAAKFDNKILLTGILPTISKTELSLDYMAPLERYKALNETMKRERKSDFTLFIQGVDELSIQHNSVMFEACNTSFQMHLQIDPQDFVSSYNWAQAISGPVLSICTNSPLLLGRQLWHETRIALFQQSIDTRSSSYALIDKMARVSFGDRWASDNIAQLFKHSIAQHASILTKEINEDAMEMVKNRKPPKLRALCFHNGTTYTWNRPCYGVGGGKAHLRIENRYIPSGPSVIDEVANFAFWVGLMKGRKSDDVASNTDFRDVKNNFIKAARYGKEALMLWEGKMLAPKELVLDKLLPMAERGLKRANVSDSDIQRLLGIIEKRASGQTGSEWMINNYRALKKRYKKHNVLALLTEAIYTNQSDNIPVHEWPDFKESRQVLGATYLVRHIMSTQLMCVKETDIANLAIQIMKWENIHHMPVIDDSGKLTGILSSTALEHLKDNESKVLSVADVMTRSIFSTTPQTSITEAKQLMNDKKIRSLPVIEEGELVGIITSNDLADLENDKS